MTLPSLETSTTQINPLDLIEELVIANDWPFQRAADDEILVEISGRWTDYRLPADELRARSHQPLDDRQLRWDGRLTDHRHRHPAGR